MMFQKRIERAYNKSREDREERDKLSQDAIYMEMMADVNEDRDLLEKGDFLALTLAAFRTIFLPALLVLVLIVGIGILLFG